MLKKLVFCGAIAAGLCSTTAALAQQGEPLKRTELQRIDYPGDKMATLLMLIEIAPNYLIPRHTHPGAEVGPPPALRDAEDQDHRRLQLR